MKRFIRSHDQTDGFTPKPRISGFNNRKLWIATGVGSLLLIFVLSFYFLSRDLPSLTQLEHYDPELATKIYSQDGVVIKELYTQKRIYVPLEEIPPFLVQAVLATEDHIFYKHWGINVKRFMYVMLINISHMRYQQGASTITQQFSAPVIPES